jgi:hypothetical protein
MRAHTTQPRANVKSDSRFGSEREIVGSVWKPFFGPDARPATKKMGAGSSGRATDDGDGFGIK